ncbi:MAG: lysophospholipid acyltransferase family protein [Pseudomonadota bacterium]|nr:lysophospholipid acyltransferase family protein [Pseudomonadota bacterium]
MSSHPSLAGIIASVMLPEGEKKRLERLLYADAGHGYDAFGLHPDYVAFGRVLTAPLYDRYFRVKSKGHEHIPTSGAAVLAANHSGAIPIDGMMLWADVLRNTEPPRVARAVADHFVPMIPLFGTLFARGGMVGGSRGNARTLLESGELLMIFPEGVPGVAKHFRDRYKLQDWRVGHVELAIRHGAPVVPVGIVGAEEQMPQIGRIPISVGGLPFIPITLTPIPMPVRYHIRYGAPIPVHLDYRPDQADDPSAVREAAARVKAAVQALLEEGLREREGIFA